MEGEGKMMYTRVDVTECANEFREIARKFIKVRCKSRSLGHH
jgi:hypothetical protein